MPTVVDPEAAVIDFGLSSKTSFSNSECQDEKSVAVDGCKAGGLRRRKWR